MHNTKTTIRLVHKPQREITPSTIVGVVLLAALLTVGLGRLDLPAIGAPAVPTATLRIIIMATRQPTAVPTVPPAPTPDLALRMEVEQLRQRVSELEARPAPDPVIIYQAAEQTQPTIAPVQPTPEPQMLAVYDRQAWAVQAATARATVEQQPTR